MLKGSVKGLFNLGRAGAAKAVKSTYVRNKMKNIAKEYVDSALDNFALNMSKKLDPTQSGSGRKASTKPYCGIGKVPKDRKRGNRSQCIDQGQIRYYGLNTIPEEAIKTIKESNSIFRKYKKKSESNKSGSGVPLPFPLVDWNKAVKVLSAPGLFSPPKVSAKEGKALVAEYKRQYKACINAGGSRSYNSWIKWKGYGGGLDIHKAILKVAPKKGFVMPGHRYTGPGNPLEQQLRYDPTTGQILEIYQQPTGKTDAVSMQHDVDYSVCANKPKSNQVKCKNDADRKMVKALDAIPWKDRQWGHAVARNAIAAKSKLGMGVKSKNVKSRRVKKTGKKN